MANETTDPRPEWVKCIASPVTSDAVCGRKEPFAWRFQGLDHAYGNAVKGGRLVACPECVDTAALAMKDV